MATTDTQMLEGRISRVCAKMRAAELRQLVISSPASIYYLTGLKVNPCERFFALLLDDSGRRTLFANPLFALDTAALPFECVLTPDGEDPLTRLADLVVPRVLGVDKDWPARFLLQLMKQHPGIKPCLGSFVVDEVRMLKDEVEIWTMKAASRLNDRVMKRAVNNLHEGMTELEVATIVSRNYTELGADLPIREQVVSFGANAADPHHSPGSTVLAYRQCALLDIFAPVDGYWCDMTRTVYMGSLSFEEEQIYDLVLAASRAAICAVRPGVPLSEVDRAARSIIEAGGYGEYFTHRTGHGVGLELHESPDVSANSNTLCAPGMVFSIEPGIYKPGCYGVRIEDLVVVTESGCEVLNTYPRDLRIL